MLCQQDKAREVEKVRRLTNAHGWQCGHKLIIMGMAIGDCICIAIGSGSLLHCYHCTASCCPTEFFVPFKRVFKLVLLLLVQNYRALFNTRTLISSDVKSDIVL